VVVKLLIALTIIGALNWGAIGLFNFNFVDAIFGGGAREETSGVSRFIYALVGLAGLALAFALPKVTAGRGERAAHP
jgi:hypothetical protein